MFYVGTNVSKELASPNFKYSGIWNCSYCHPHTNLLKLVCTQMCSSSYPRSLESLLEIEIRRARWHLKWETQQQCLF